MPEIVITAVGPDRPGLVNELSGFLLSAGGNIADSRMVNLRGEFAVIMLIDAADAAATLIRQGVVEAGKKIGLAVAVSPHSAPGTVPGTAPGTVPGSAPGSAPGTGGKAGSGVPFRLKTYAMDQPGIVHRITQLLHRRGVNIEELQTRLEAGSYTGTPLFTMEMRLTVPTTVPVIQLRRELEELCDALNCDIDLEPA